MALTPGTRLGVYEVTALIGEGGMGQVYRATDTKLKRQVAIKILPPSLAADHDRLTRFQREAEVLASLNHPHIAAIYGLEESGDMTALVMELVEGDDLSQRIAKGAIPLNEALPIAKQIADALEAAHEQGIIHRDLKPANIKVRADGTVKVLDFGLAKATHPVGVSSRDTMNSPTVATPAMTRAGMILGTAAYMSPEQARGKPIDKRCDIWAFGCVLYEMLAGRQAFPGDSVSDHLAAILERDPDWSALPPTTSAAVGRLLRRCLDKDARRRLRDIGDAKPELEAAPEPAAASRQPRSKIAVAAVASMAVTLLLAAAVGAFFVNRSNQAPAAITRLVIPLSSDDGFLGGGGDRIVALSPDGRRVVYVANQRLYMRPLDQLEATVIAGTEPVATASVVGGRAPGLGASNPFFSSDGQWVGFTQGGLLKKVAVGGGSPVAIDSGLGGFSAGADWLPDGFILLGRRSVEGRSGGIWMVPAAGGSGRQVAQLDTGTWPMTPQMLPGGMHILLTLSEGSNWDDADIVVQSLKDGGRQILVHGGVAGRYVNSGHLIYGHSGSLHAVRFDPSTRRVSGPAVPVVSGIAQATSGGAWGGLEYAVSDTGTLAYVPAAAVAIRRVLVWVDRSGREEQVPAEPRAYEYPRISPDGARVLVESRDEQNDLWSWDLVRGTLTRVTFNRRSGGPGVWTHDGAHVLFGPDRGGIINIFQQHFGGTGSEERLLTSPNTQYADVVSPDGRWLVYEETDPTTKFDLRLLALDGSRASTPLLHMPFNEQNADISPDGRWLAYQSDESGRAEVYVRPFPDVAEGRWQISTGGGTRPLWSRDGRELFYLDADRQLTAAPVETRSSFRVTSAARKLFDTKPFGMAGINRNFDVSPDGKRFLFTKNLRTPPDAKRIIVVGNWLEDLKQRVPAK